MTTLSRQNTLFVSEDWVRIYDAIQNVDFRAYSQETLTQALLDYLRVNYPEEFNDWVVSSEFVTKLEVLGWLSQNLAFRTDLNKRENLRGTATRREAILQLADNIAYKVNRVRGARGDVKIVSVRTDQPLIDSNNTLLQNIQINWNDPANEDWYEQFILILNRAFTARTQYGKPVARYVDGVTKIEQYLLNSRAPTNGVYTFTGSVNGASLPFEVVNSSLNPTTGVVAEISPDPSNVFALYYKADGRGTASDATGFFLPIRQGTMNSLEQSFDTAEIMRTTLLGQNNVNNDDLFVQQIDADGRVVTNWTRVDTVFGEGIGFNTLPSTTRTIYETQTLPEDQVRIRFGDGKFGEIPLGLYRFWYRTSSPTPAQIKPDNIEQKTVIIPYVNNGAVYYLTVTFSLMEAIVNAAASETNLDIKSRMAAAQYAQNRMVTAADYNNFILTDNSIMKAKVVNRTFAGHSRYAKLNDPTGIYENIKALGEDGRIYITDTTATQSVSANPDVLTVDQLVTRYLKVILRKEDKKILYYYAYPEQYVDDGTVFVLDGVVGPNAKGNIRRNDVAQPVGSDAPDDDALRFIAADATVRFKRLTGPVSTIATVVEDGTDDDGIIFREKNLTDGAAVISVMPAIRNAFTDAEITTIKQNLGSHLTFGVTWNQLTASYQVISATNLDKTSDFSLQYQGDTTNETLDASWLFYVEFVAGTDGNDDRWVIVDRGESIRWESASEIDFYYSGDGQPIFDTQTGRTLFDSVKLLGINESKNSLRRRGLSSKLLNECGVLVLSDTGDGSKTCFQISEHPIDPAHFVVLVDDALKVNGADYSISPNQNGDSICFVTAPANNALIEFRLSNSVVYANQQVRTAVSDGTLREFELGVEEATANNIISAVDGAFQNPGRDYTMTMLNGEAAILYDEALPTATTAVAYTLGDMSSTVFRKSDYIGDGTETEFACNVKGQSASSVIVIYDGALQSPLDYTVNNTNDPNSSVIIFGSPVPDGVRVVIYAALYPSLLRSIYHTFTGDNVTSVFTLTGIASISQYQPIVALDGAFQLGPYAASPSWSINGSNRIQFTAPVPSGAKVTVFSILGAVGVNCDAGELVDTNAQAADTDDMCAKYDFSSQYVHFMGCEAVLQVKGVLRHDNGFINSDGLVVSPADSDVSGTYDNPFLFKDIVIADGSSDLVLWQRATKYGYSVWSAITPNTSPKGVYGKQSVTGIQAGVAYDTTEFAAGDIYYDVTDDQWLIATASSGNWEVASSQSNYRHRIGRDLLRFIWTHYSSDSRRIDPSKTNLHDAYLLIRSYYDAYAAWIRINGADDDEPEFPSAESLRVQYQSFQDYKIDTDSLIFHAARIKPLFGSKAISELRAVFKCIKTPGSRISDNDLRLRVLRAIETFFDPTQSRWDFGASFYFTELVAYVHKQLAPDLQSMVIVPTGSGQVFGRLFQIQSEADELFISSAQPDDIELVSSFTDDELRIGSYV